MCKKLTAPLLLLLLCATAVAEVYDGTTAALSTTVVTAETSGMLQKQNVQVGDCVNAGDALMSLKSTRTFAAQNGTVSLINAQTGDDIDGTVLELMPLERYLIYCTVDKAYQSAQSTLVHSGERVYVRCTSDGSHRAIGVLTQIDGEEYRVQTVGGELYLGETVYLYRDESFSSSQRIGIGTVVSNDTQSYDASGTLTGLYVGEGDEVERGQLLYEIGGGDVTAPASGIVTSVSVESGASVEKDQVVAEIVPDGQICVEIRVSESDASRIAPGQTVGLTLISDIDERIYEGTVIDIAWVAEKDTYTVRILPEEGLQLPLGMTVTVRTQES